MPGLLLTTTAKVACAHQGAASPSAGAPRVSLGGVPAVLQTAPYTVAGCAAPPQTGGPDATGTWTTGTTRVTANGVPLAVLTSTGTCAPTGVPMQAQSTQTRVRAT
ncbi:hypothetical protein [Isoptericola sp. G70]|uniref:hypothetical protein n=1 Tax=Isoptericola sp. G70 TaxID=3376633 RepID=UPI003A806015